MKKRKKKESRCEGVGVSIPQLSKGNLIPISLKFISVEM